MGTPRLISLPVLHVRQMEPPGFAKRNQLSTCQLRGKTYERKVYKTLKRQCDAGEWPNGELLYGPWLEYVDQNGPGICQPDLVMILPDTLMIFEVKLKQTLKAWDQLDKYVALCSLLWPRDRIFQVQTFKFPTCDKSARRIVNPRDLLALIVGGVYCWHYIP